MGCCWSSEPADDTPAPLPPVALSSQLCATEIKLEDRTISGTGSVLGDSAILQARRKPAASRARRSRGVADAHARPRADLTPHMPSLSLLSSPQDKGYFEVTIRKAGAFAIGVAAKDCPLEGLLTPDKAATAWTVTSTQPGLPPLQARPKHLPVAPAPASRTLHRAPSRRRLAPPPPVRPRHASGGRRHRLCDRPGGLPGAGLLLQGLLPRAPDERRARPAPHHPPPQKDEAPSHRRGREQASVARSSPR